MTNPWVPDELPEIPDLFKPLHLYKELSIFSGGSMIRSPVQGYHWTGGENSALHEEFRQGGGEEQMKVALHARVPQKGCVCGFYGYWLPDTARMVNSLVSFGGRSSILAYVEAYGRAIKHPLGMRAEKMVILAAWTRGRPISPAIRAMYPSVQFYNSRKEFMRACPAEDIRSINKGRSAIAERRRWILRRRWQQIKSITHLG